MRFRAVLVGLALAAAPAAGPAAAHDKTASEFDAKAALAYSGAAIGRAVGDHVFASSEGQTVRLSDFRGKPLVVNFVYTACTHTCPIIVQTLARAVDVSRDAVGADAFAVVTVGFDTVNDTPPRMRAYARAQGVDLPNWHFLSGAHGAIDALAADLGFLYFDSAKGFDHLSQVTVVDAEGRVYRQVYGDSFEPRDLGEPLRQLVLGRNISFTTVEGLVNRVRLFCTLYDPIAEHYRVDYSIVISLVVGLASLTAFAVLLVRGLVRVRQRTRDA